MLRLDTQFNVQNISSVRLLKVLTFDELMKKGLSVCAGQIGYEDIILWIDNNNLKDLEKFLNLPVAGVVLSSGYARSLKNDKIILSCPKDDKVVQPGDVISVGPNSNVVRVLYRRGSDSNLLFITDRCNSYCLMCSQPPKNINDYWHIEENLFLIDLLDPAHEQLGISGGEPTLYRNGLLKILKKSKLVLPQKELHVLSNGRSFKDPSWVDELVEIDHPALTWGIPLYADNAVDHDHVVQAVGAFSETMQGIYNLARAKQKIEIRVVLSKLTVARLPELAYFIFRNMPFVEHVALMGIENTGLAKKNYEALWIDPLDYQETLKQACHYLEIRGINVSIYNLPLCVVDTTLFPFYRRSISDWKNVFVDECQSCSAAENHCAGFFKSHSERWQSRGIRPLAPAELDNCFEDVL